MNCLFQPCCFSRWCALVSLCFIFCHVFLDVRPVLCRWIGMLDGFAPRFKISLGLFGLPPHSPPSLFLFRYRLISGGSVTIMPHGRGLCNFCFCVKRIYLCLSLGNECWWPLTPHTQNPFILMSVPASRLNPALPATIANFGKILKIMDKIEFWNIFFSTIWYNVFLL